MKKLIHILLLMLMPVFSMAQQNEWQPIAVWPFIYKDFKNAIITTTTGAMVKGKANIHVGNHSLWYESGQKRLEAKSGTIAKIVFDDNSVFYTIENKLCRVLREDTIRGRIGRVLVSEEADKDVYTERVKASRMAMQSMDVGLRGIEDLYSDMADRTNSVNIEEEPMPMHDIFYMQVGSDTFHVTEGNILKRLPKEERTVYKNYTRNAEIIYGNRSSILKIWSTFFVR